MRVVYIHSVHVWNCGPIKMGARKKLCFTRKWRKLFYFPRRRRRKHWHHYILVLFSRHRCGRCCCCSILMRGDTFLIWKMNLFTGTFSSGNCFFLLLVFIWAISMMMAPAYCCHSIGSGYEKARGGIKSEKYKSLAIKYAWHDHEAPVRWVRFCVYENFNCGITRVFSHTL